MGNAETVAPRAAVQVGLIATPSLGEENVAQLAAALQDLLSERYPDLQWDVAHVRDRLVVPPVELTELVDAARARLLEEGWDLTVFVTDLPLRLARRPMLSHSSPTHGVGLISLPALGVRNVQRRLLDALGAAIGVLAGDSQAALPQGRGLTRRARVQRRLVELATDTEDPSGRKGVTFVARVITGNVGLILGMIRANRPWRLVGHLSKALLGALAAGTYALVTSDAWRIADHLDAARFVALTLVSVGIAVVTLIVAHELWERAEDRRMREQVVLFNLVTLVTVAFGILSLYAAIFIAAFAGAALLIDSSLFADAVGHPVDVSEYLQLAWVASSLATVGGALGGVLESDAAVREAAYAYRADDQAGPAPTSAP